MIQYESELIHHGVKGMHWGVRKKYQSPDGHLTERGNKAVSAYKKYRSINRMDAAGQRAYFKKNKRAIRVGAKIQANKGDMNAHKMALNRSSAKYKAGAAVLAGIGAVRAYNTIKLQHIARKQGVHIKPSILNLAVTGAMFGGAAKMQAESERRKKLASEIKAKRR